MSSYTKEIHKALCGCVSQDIARPALCGVLFETNDGVKCNLTAMDGHLGVHYKDILIYDLGVFLKLEYGVTLPTPKIGKDIIIYMEPKIRKKLKYTIFKDDETYPNWQSVIPEKFDCDFAKRPIFITEQLERLRKLFGITLYTPDKWNGLLGITIKNLDGCGSFVYLMPGRPTDKSWVGYKEYQK